MIISSELLEFKKDQEISFSKLSSLGILDKVIKELIREDIINKIEIPEEEKELIKINWCKSKNINNNSDIKKWQDANNQSQEDWMRFILREYRWSKWCLEKFERKIPMIFKEKKSFLDKYIYSMIRTKKEGLSKELFLRIKENESDFYSIAKEFSEGIEKNSGGLIGPVNLNNPHPIISNILKISEVNQLWPPKKINNWWVIIRLEEKINAKLDSDLKINLSRELGEKYLIKKLINYKKANNKK